MVIMLHNKRVNGNYALHSLVVFGSFVLCGNRYLHTAPPAMAVYDSTTEINQRVDPHLRQGWPFPLSK